MTAQQVTGAMWVKRFQRLNGRRADAQWAGELVAKLKRAGVPTAQIDQILKDAFQRSLEEQAGPHEALGSVDRVAAERIEALSLAGAQFEEPAVNHRGIVVGCLLFGVVLASVLGVIDTMDASDREWDSASVLTVPIQVLALLVAGETYATWAQRHSPWSAIGLAVLTALPVVLLDVVVSSRMSIPLGHHASAWWFALALVLAAAAAAAYRWVPRARPQPVQVCTDQQWANVAAAELRRRDDLTRTTAGEVIAQAKDHATHAGTSLADEFGHPRAYVHTLPAQPAIALRRAAWFATAILLFDVVVLAPGDMQPWKIIVIAGAATCAAGLWLCALRARTNSY